ncbi:hypothetical protein QQ045_031149 [Rhodiola kirilowii]
MATGTTELISQDLNKKYSSLQNIRIGIQTKNLWEDSNLTGLEHLNIQSYQDSQLQDKELLMKTALESIYKSVTAASVGAVLACAWRPGF